MVNERTHRMFEPAIISLSPSPKLAPFNRPKLTGITRQFAPLISIRCSSMSSPTSPSTGDRRHRVIVCGGGVIGVCTAYFLSKKGAAVTVIEQSSIACAASGKAGGFLALDWCDGGPVGQLARASFNLHRSLAEELDGPRSYGYRALTTLGLTLDESGGGGGPSISTSAAESSKVLPPWVDGPARNCRTIGTPQTTAQVHPGMFTSTVMKAAMDKYGAEVLVGKVEKVVEGSGGGRLGSVVLTDGRLIEADSVVLALGPWTAKMAILPSMFRVYGLKAHSIVLEPKDADAITPHALFLTYFRSDGGKPIDPEVYPRPTGEVYICGMSAEEEVPDDPEQIHPNPESIQVLKRVAKMVSASLEEGEAKIKAEQACFLPCSDDGDPIIGEIPGLKGCFVATGHSCWGILNGPATGAALAELVIDGSASLVDLTAFSPSRFVARSRKR